MKVSFYCPQQKNILSTTQLPSNVTEVHISMIHGFMSKEKDLPSDHIVFHDSVIRKFFVFNQAQMLTVNQQIEAIELIDLQDAVLVKAD